MSNQIFKVVVPKEFLFELLDKICLKTDKYYHFDNNAYRKMLFNNYHIEFCEKLKPYYHLGKLLERVGQFENAIETYEKGMLEAKKAGDQHAYYELMGARDELVD